MKKEKILINIEQLNDIEEYKKIGINNFLFAVSDFSIGYESFKLEELENLECNKYLLINRIFNSEDCENFKSIISKLNMFDGVLFEDIAVYNMLKNTNINLIWNQTHFATNYSSINHWLELVDSVVVSNELTIEEVSEILDKSNKELILNIFGKNPIMYSRRTLLTNFNKNFKLGDNREMILNETITKNEFLAKETDKGTFILNNKHFNLISFLKEFNEKKISLYLIYPNGLNVSEIEEYLNGNEDNTDDGFAHRKTIYKLR